MPVIGLGARIAEYTHLPLRWMPHIQVADMAASVQCALALGGCVLMQAKDDDGKSQWAVLLDPNGAALGPIRLHPNSEVLMPIHRPVIALMAVNLLILLLVASQARPDRSSVDVLRGRALELIDESGQIRARLDVDEAGEVVLRMIDQNGTIRVKMGAAEHGSGLLLIDEATEPAVHIIARRSPTSSRPNTTSITLRGADAQQRVITP